jgi:FMN phosphatase YigB (HAD superfamily)
MPATPAFFYFDLGNVLLSFSHDRMCQQMAEVAGVSADLVRHALFETAGSTRSVQWRFERGDLNVLAVYDHFCETLGVEPNRDELFAAGRDIFEVITDSVAIIEQIAAAGHRLGIMSNTNTLDWEFVTSGRYPFLNNAFEQYVLSFEVRAMKPEPAIYEHAVKLAGAEPSQVFFTDDRQENVDGALAVGLDATLFTTPAKLCEDLESRGILLQ